MRVKVEAHPDLEKDTASGAIVNSDNLAFRSHKKRRQAALHQKNTIQSMQTTIDTLQEQMTHLNSTLDLILSTLQVEQKNDNNNT